MKLNDSNVVVVERTTTSSVGPSVSESGSGTTILLNAGNNSGVIPSGCVGNGNGSVNVAGTVLVNVLPPWNSSATSPPSSGCAIFPSDLISTTFPCDDEDSLLLSGPSPSKGSVELDALLIVQNSVDSVNSPNFAELKPLPPFEYAIVNHHHGMHHSGHPNHGNGQHLQLANDPHMPQMTSNTSPLLSSGALGRRNVHGAGGAGSTGGSSTASTGSISPPSSGHSFGGSPPHGPGGSPLFDTVSSSTCSSSNNPPSSVINIKSELAEYLLTSDIDDIAALIGNAIADSTVPSLGIDLGDPNVVTSSTIDPWGELDAWIESACNTSNNHHNIHRAGVPVHIIGGSEQEHSIHTSGGSAGAPGHNNGLNPGGNNGEFLESSTSSTSTLQTLLSSDPFISYNGTGGNSGQDVAVTNKVDFNSHQGPQSTSILQSRLTSGNVGGLHMSRLSSGVPVQQQQLPESTTTFHGLKVDPTTNYMMDSTNPGQYLDSMPQRPHTTHVSPPVVTSSMMRTGNGNNASRYQRKQQQGNANGYRAKNGQGPGQAGGQGQYDAFIGYGYDPSTGNTNLNQLHQQHPPLTKTLKTKRKSGKSSNNGGALTVAQELDALGKEKPIHRCGICNRGFLNKSNIKVHLRTHTGEKPFKCDTCGKAFRQKAHLLKHIQIHKRIPRD